MSRGHLTHAACLGSLIYPGAHSYPAMNAEPRGRNVVVEHGLQTVSSAPLLCLSGGQSLHNLKAQFKRCPRPLCTVPVAMLETVVRTGQVKRKQQAACFVSCDNVAALAPATTRPPKSFIERCRTREAARGAKSFVGLKASWTNVANQGRTVIELISSTRYR